MQMKPYPLSNFIRNRLFDHHQEGLESRFAAHKFKYQLVYCEPTDNSAMRIEFEYRDQIGQMTVWESGECDLEVMEIETEKVILWKHYQINNEQEFHQLLAKFFLYFRDGTDLPA